MCVGLPGEGDLPVMQGDEPAVGDGHPVRVASQVLVDLLGAAEGSLVVDDPLLLIERPEEAIEGVHVTQVGDASVESELPRTESLLQGVQEFAAEEASKDADREKESTTTSDPATPVRRKPSARHDAVDVGMDTQGLAPGVEDSEAADLRTQVLGIAGDLLEGLGRGSEQDAVDHLLVLERERRELVWDAEDEMEIRHRQEFLASVLDPLSTSQLLALGTMPVPAGVVSDLEMLACVTALDVTTAGRGAARRKVMEDLAFCAGDATVSSGTEISLVTPHDVGHLQVGATHRPDRGSAFRGG